VLLEPVEARLPLALLLGEPATQLSHALDVQPARTSLTLDPLMDKPATSKDADVAGDGLLRQVERLGELSDSRLPLRQSHDHCPTSRVAERREGSVEVASAGHMASISTTFCLCNQAVVLCRAEAAYRLGDLCAGRAYRSVQPNDVADSAANWRLVALPAFGRTARSGTVSASRQRSA
jgi:hypothetical protein